MRHPTGPATRTPAMTRLNDFARHPGNYPGEGTGPGSAVNCVPAARLNGSAAFAVMTIPGAPCAGGALAGACPAGARRQAATGPGGLFMRGYIRGWWGPACRALRRAAPEAGACPAGVFFTWRWGGRWRSFRGVAEAAAET